MRPAMLLGAFLLLGPTGVGKTELAKASDDVSHKDLLSSQRTITVLGVDKTELAKAVLLRPSDDVSHKDLCF